MLRNVGKSISESTRSDVIKLIYLIIKHTTNSICKFIKYFEYASMMLVNETNKFAKKMFSLKKLLLFIKN